MPIYGTRPEAIKMAPIIAELSRSDLLDCRVAVTGQHRGMLDQVNRIFGITPAYDLDIFEERQTLSSIMSRTMEGLDSVFKQIRPDAVVVQGDTTSSTAAAIAAFYHGIAVIHVEAGLRSGDPFSPFPEEANRKLTSQVSSLHLAPTAASRNNLLAENIPSRDIVVTGNTVIDALLTTVERKAPFSDQILEDLASSGKQILLATTHRRENQGEAMRGIGRALARLADHHPDIAIVLPIHKNPVVRAAVIPEIQAKSNILVIEPLEYADFTRLLSLAHVVLTDSGGVQEEAPSLGKPVLVMRENTERPEAVQAGTVALIGTNEDRIFNEVSNLFADSTSYSSMANATNPYGDGMAARRVVAAITCLLGLGERMPDFEAAAKA